MDATPTHDGRRPAARAPRPSLARPEVAVPTVVLHVALLGLWVGALWAAVTDRVPTAVAVPVLAFVGFAQFTVLHDAAHRGTGRSRTASEVLGRTSMLFVVPYGSFPMFRWLHLAHHGHVNEGNATDPDHWVIEGPAWQLPLRWAVVDLRYLTFWVRNVRSRPRAEVVETVGAFVAWWTLVALLVQAGHGAEVLVLVVLPQRIHLTVLAWWFDWLPHHGLEETNTGDRYRTTRNIVGMEWLLTPLLFSQNYHLLHHLHPIVPFYRYVQAWRQDEAAHLDQGPALATPTLRPVDPEAYRAARGLG